MYLKNIHRVRIIATALLVFGALWPFEHLSLKIYAVSTFVGVVGGVCVFVFNRFLLKYPRDQFLVTVILIIGLGFFRIELRKFKLDFTQELVASMQYLFVALGLGWTLTKAFPKR